MTQPTNTPQVVRTRQQLGLLPGTEGPLLPGECRPIAPVPAASGPSDPPPCTEREALRALVKHYGWCWTGQAEIRKLSCRGPILYPIDGGQDDG
jgi:hypothetical protein